VTTTLLVALGWLVGWVLLWRAPPWPSGDRTPTGDDVAVVVPARDEEDRLPLLLGDLAAQSVTPGQVVVVDDGSTDRTAAVAAAQPGVAVVAAPEPPAGWTGKTWALDVGVDATTAPVVVAVDADVRLAPDALGRVLAAHRQLGGLVSVQPRHDVGGPVEGLSLLFNVVGVMGLGIAVPGPRRPGWGVAGPLLVTAREDLARVGGFGAVRREVVEDLALAAAYRRSGRPVWCLLGGDQVRYRMYRRLRDLLVGWRKNMAAGARRTPPLLGVGTALWVAALAAAAVEVARPLVGSGPSPAVAVALYVVVAVQVGVLGRRVGRFGPAAVLWPVLVATFVAVFTWSAVSTFVLRRVRWSGRTIRL